MPKDTLKIENLNATIEGKEILKGINLEIKSGEIHVIMGPNGSGKSTLCNVLMGHPKYKIKKGNIYLNNKSIKNRETNERAAAGLFLAFQHPTEIPGVSFGTFLRLAKNAQIKRNNKKAQTIRPIDFLNDLQEATKTLSFKEEFIGRSVNEGFSGGEKKRAEIIQMTILEPKFAILDEIDSGLDIDGLKAVANGIKKLFKKTNSGILLITHYQRILNYITPNFVHILADGKIVKSGTKKLAQELEKKGYKNFMK
jgi:Fe-S cluster assembly ATP-binding protein